MFRCLDIITDVMCKDMLYCFCPFPFPLTSTVACSMVLQTFDQFCLSRVTDPSAGQKLVQLSQVTEPPAGSKTCVMVKNLPRWTVFWHAPLCGAKYCQLFHAKSGRVQNSQNDFQVTVMALCRIDQKSTVCLLAFIVPICIRGYNPLHDLHIGNLFGRYCMYYPINQ